MIDILFVDEFILVINKPAGLISIADGYDPKIPYIRSILEPQFGRLWVIHRLDKETSGVMVLARSAPAHQNLNDQFANRIIQKSYIALVYGEFPPKLSCTFPLRVNGDRRHRTVIDEENGKPAITDFTLLDVFPNRCSQITALPHTGYTHQIRAHLLRLGYPILGDSLYCSKESKEFSLGLPIKRCALHAQSLTFNHPVDNRSISFSADPPVDFTEAINHLNKKRLPKK